jgi:hypothetical protein
MSDGRDLWGFGETGRRSGAEELTHDADLRGFARSITM